MRGGWLVSIATAFVVLGASIVPFLTPAFVGFEQDRSGAPALTGFGTSDLRAVTNSILGDLVLGQGDFAVEQGGTPVLSEAERQHMRDVRGVFAGFALLVLVSVVVVGLAWRRTSRANERASFWAAVRRGAAGMTIVIAVLAAISIVAFDAAFEVFHRLFFASGSYTFDPSTSHLVQLFPERFWSEVTIAVGVVAFLMALTLAAVARRRSSGDGRAPTGTVPVREVAR